MKYAEQRTVASWTVQFEKSLEKEKLKLSNWCVSFSTGSGSLAAPIFSKKDRAQINNKQKYDMKKLIIIESGSNFITRDILMTYNLFLETPF